MKNVLKLFSTIFIVTLVVFAFDQGRMLLTDNYVFPKRKDVLLLFSLYYLYSFVIGISNISLVAYLQKKYSWLEAPKKRAIYGVIGAVVVSMLSIVVLRIFTVLVVEKKTWSYFLEHETIFGYIYSLLITLVIVLVFYVINFYKAIIERAVSEQKNIIELEKAKYENLKKQLDPHFLFNSLNVLASLIEEDTEKAVEFTTTLARIYRYVLDQKDKTLVPLEEEIDFVESYITLLQMRFEDAIKYTVSDEVKKLKTNKIIPLALQLLLENAIKHNDISVTNPLIITITKENDYLVVINNVNKKQTKNKNYRNKIGLSNIIERNKLLTSQPIIITENNDFFKVMLPLFD